jgi:hypothetical protein
MLSQKGQSASRTIRAPRRMRASAQQPTNRLQKTLPTQPGSTFSSGPYRATRTSYNGYELVRVCVCFQCDCLDGPVTYIPVRAIIVVFLSGNFVWQKKTNILNKSPNSNESGVPNGLNGRSRDARLVGKPRKYLQRMTLTITAIEATILYRIDRIKI